MRKASNVTICYILDTSAAELTSLFSPEDLMPLRKAITGDYAKQILREHGFTPNPEPYASPMPIEENEKQAWFDVNAGAVRRGDVMPDYPIRILFDKVQHPMYVDFVPAGARELTAEEAKESKALSREPWDTKVSPWPPRKSGG